jgi:hypothetical protein
MGLRRTGDPSFQGSKTIVNGDPGFRRGSERIVNGDPGFRRSETVVNQDQEGWTMVKTKRAKRRARIL